MLSVIKYIWQLPQNLLGLAIIKILNCIYYINDSCYFATEPRFSVSLGKYIIFGDMWPTDDLLNHERGHCKQSMYLGWLYLIVIGLPSAIGNLLHRVFKFDYYKQPWEAWADKLGGVNRKRS